jgi:hypothetical protein
MSHDQDRDYIDRKFTSLTTAEGWDEPAPTLYGPAPKAPMSTQTKALLGLAGLVIVGGSAVGFAAYSASSQQAEVRAQELAVQAQQLEIERVKNTVPDTKAEERRIAAFQACIEKAGMAKDVCAQAFPASSEGSSRPSLNTIGSASASGSGEGGGIGVSGGLVVGLVAVSAVGYVVRKANKSSNPQ